MNRHPIQTWAVVEEKLNQHRGKWEVLQAAENTGNEPNGVDFSTQISESVFCTCSTEYPADRKSLC